MQINSIVDAARITSKAEADAGLGAPGAPGVPGGLGGAKRPREGGLDAMAELEAQAVAAMGLGAAAGLGAGAGAGGARPLSGFVSAGVIQQGGEKDGAGKAQGKAPVAGAWACVQGVGLGEGERCEVALLRSCTCVFVRGPGRLLVLLVPLRAAVVAWCPASRSAN